MPLKIQSRTRVYFIFLLTKLCSNYLAVHLVTGQQHTILVGLFSALLQPRYEILQRGHFALCLQDLARVHVLEHPIAADVDHPDAEAPSSAGVGVLVRHHVLAEDGGFASGGAVPQHVVTSHLADLVDEPSAGGVQVPGDHQVAAVVRERGCRGHGQLQRGESVSHVRMCSMWPGKS